MRPMIPRRVALAFLLLGLGAPASGEWINRYPKVANVAHHVYLEGFNLPTLGAGPTDPASSPDGRTIALAARGWLWLMDVESREARRLTRGGGVDLRPAWSPDGRQIAFVRDESDDTSIVMIDVASGRERVLVDTPAMDLDPVFSPDGRSVFFSSGEAGDLDLWRIDVSSGERQRLTTARGLELSPQPLAGGEELAFVWKASGSADSVALLNLRDGTQRQLREEGIASQMRLSSAPTGRGIAANLPVGDRWHLFLMDAAGGTPIRLAHSADYVLSPSWTRDGRNILFVQPGSEERFHLYRVAATGGEAEDISPLSWDWGQPTARVTIRSRVAGSNANVPARLSVADRNGHPVIPETGASRFDGQHGRVFFYSPGIITLEVPAGRISVQASHGFSGATQIYGSARPSEEVMIDLDLPTTGFDAAARGWYSADLHSHLNYGGPYHLAPEDIVLDMRAEKLDLATPHLANLQTNFIDREWQGWRRTEKPMIAFAQEVRSHFLGHVGVVGADALFSPWYFGPGYPVYSDLDLSNAAPLRFAREHGGMNIYVHPVTVADPFPDEGEPSGLPLELVPDAVLGDVDTIELACLWSDELGTAEAWYRLLNLGLPIMPSAGSDTMHNFHRTMAIGATRIYAKPQGAMNLPNFLAAVRTGRSFVTTGPMIEFSAGGVEPGGVIPSSPRSVEWTIDAWSPVPFERVEIVVNGEVAWTGRGLKAAGQRRYSGRIDVPAGGWIAARVHGGKSSWPVQDSYPFAHSAPIWLGATGSSDPEAARRSAQDLLRWLKVAERRLEQGYPGAAGLSIKARFAQARQILELRARP